MTIRVAWMAGVCVLALCAAAAAAPRAKNKPLKCASPAEVSAMQAVSIQQELMVAALACDRGDDHTARDNYNAFQTRFAPEMRVSDQAMLRMFGRVMGGRAGDKAYNLFKTELAARSELRRTHNHDDFCQEANLVAAAALGPSKIGLADFVADIPAVDIAGPVNSCSIELTVTFQGAKAIPGIVPRPNPLPNRGKSRAGSGAGRRCAGQLAGRRAAAPSSRNSVSASGRPGRPGRTNGTNEKGGPRGPPFVMSSDSPYQLPRSMTARRF